MGMLIEGRWSDEREIAEGRYRRAGSVYDGDISAELANGLQHGPGRYCLIVSMSCQWSQRTLITRALKGLQDMIPMHIAFGPRLQGYAANAGKDWQVPGSDLCIRHLHQLYSLGDADYSGTVTVPLLWDSVEQRILSNESARIQRAFDALPAENNFKLVPAQLLAEIDALNLEIHANLCNAVYEAGFAQSQAAYDDAVERLFRQLDKLELMLSRQRYLFGNVFTETDINLFSTLVRFDSVYYLLHRCSKRRLIDYPALWAYSRDLYACAEIAATVDFDVIRQGSYQNDTQNNPFAIVAAAPLADWSAPQQRAQLGGSGPGGVAVSPGSAPGHVP